MPELFASRPILYQKPFGRASCSEVIAKSEAKLQAIITCYWGQIVAFSAQGYSKFSSAFLSEDILPKSTIECYSFRRCKLPCNLHKLLLYPFFVGGNPYNWIRLHKKYTAVINSYDGQEAVTLVLTFALSTSDVEISFYSFRRISNWLNRDMFSQLHF